MGYEQHGPPMPGQQTTKVILARRVQVHRRIIEQEDGGIAEECSPKGDELSLPRGQIMTPLSHPRLETGGQLSEHFVEANGEDHPLHFFL